MTNMRAWMTTSLIAGVTVLALSPALAQEKSKNVATFTDWSVFHPKDPVECYIASQPTKSVAKRDGKTLSKVNRSAITLYVSTRPAENVVNEVSFSAGYPLRPESSVNVKIGDTSFDFFYIDGEVAWPDSPEQDKKVIAAMKRGSTAVVTGISRRGTTTIDTFSLLGFTDALSDGSKRCNIAS